MAACATEAPLAPVEDAEPLPVPSAPIAFSMETPPEPVMPPEPTDSGSEDRSREVRFDGEPILVGAMGVAEFVDVVDGYRPDLARCTRHRLPEPHVVVKVTISKDGSVIGAAMKTSSGSPPVDSCLEKRFMAMRFPAPNSGLVIAAIPIDLGAERGPAPAPVTPKPPEDPGPERDVPADGTAAPDIAATSEGSSALPASPGGGVGGDVDQ